MIHTIQSTTSYVEVTFYYMQYGTRNHLLIKINKINLIHIAYRYRDKLCILQHNIDSINIKLTAKYNYAELNLDFC